MFTLFQILFFCVFGFIIFQWIRNWNHNRSQPRVAAPATVVTKRTDYSSHHHNSSGNSGLHHGSTWYYITFEFSTGDRKEFLIDASEYGLLRENDRGVLTFQGNRFVGFQREGR